MTRFSWFGYEVDVDQTATANWYAQAEEWGCECGHCRNFLALARARRLPAEILGILDALRIPPEKATYVCELYYDEDWAEKGLLYQASWRIAGEILDKPAGEDAGPDWGPAVTCPAFTLTMGHEEYPYGAPDFPQPHFDIDVSLYLPWVLDESLEGEKEE